MNLTLEVELIQNSALGALALWTFSREFQSSNSEDVGPELQLSTFVLPIIFHEESLEAIRTRRIEGGLFTTLAHHRDFGLGLQERAEAMLPETMQALNLAFASRLLSYDTNSGRLTVVRKTTPYVSEVDSTRRIVAGAKRLGCWFATTETQQVCSLLNVSF